MTSQSVAIKLFGEEAKATCEFCKEEYTIKDSDAWDMQIYCSGECETLDDESNFDHID